MDPRRHARSQRRAGIDTHAPGRGGGGTGGALHRADRRAGRARRRGDLHGSRRVRLGQGLPVVLPSGAPPRARGDAGEARRGARGDPRDLPRARLRRRAAGPGGRPNHLGPAGLAQGHDERGAGAVGPVRAPAWRSGGGVRVVPCRRHRAGGAVPVHRGARGAGGLVRGDRSGPAGGRGGAEPIHRRAAVDGGTRAGGHGHGRCGSGLVDRPPRRRGGPGLMGEISRYPEGTFCWVDLGTEDLDGARAFYRSLLGWAIEEVESPDPGPYLIARVDGKDVAGLHAHGEGTAHGWDSYIAVDDLDATLAGVQDLGGAVEYGPHDIPSSARMAVVAGGDGARVCLWQAAGFDGARLVNETGTWAWSDLSTRNPDAAEAFYGGLFGWTFRQLAPVYWSISMGEDLLIGGMRTMDEDPPETSPSWMPYFVVADVDDAARRVPELGGAVIVPPREVPGGRFLVTADPAGAFFGSLQLGPAGAARGVDSLGG